MTEDKQTTERQVELKTGAQRALRDQAERALYLQEFYKNTPQTMNSRAAIRRATKSLEKHKQAMANLTKNRTPKKYKTLPTE